MREQLKSTTVQKGQGMGITWGQLGQVASQINALEQRSIRVCDHGETIYAGKDFPKSEEGAQQALDYLQSRLEEAQGRSRKNA
jgi:hypothetical protein